MTTPHADGLVPSRATAARRGGLDLRLAAAGVLLVALAVYFAFFRARPVPPTDPAPRDPRRDYAGPFQNIDPDVRYVSDAKCAGCHKDKAASYAQHPMGRSLFPVAETEQPPEDAPHNNPFEALGSQFRVERDGKRVRHRRSRAGPDGRPAAELAWDVHYVLGSGTRGYSFLTERDGCVLQTPVSWYAQKQKWDLSPGFDTLHLTGRAIVPECLYCHANRAHHRANTRNRYAEPVFDGHAIGCQRCHGPGELHVASRGATERGAGGVDYTIVNPRHLDPPLREGVCEQCHLQGVDRLLRRGRGLDDYRPGLPFEQFWSVFVRAPEAGGTRNAVGHVEQMYQSRCFQGGGPKQLGCVSCHDPHERVPPERRVTHYRARCLECHEQRGCGLPAADRLRRSAADSCIDCHMPRYSAADIPHTAGTDHRIPRGKAAPEPPRPAPGDGAPVVSFYGDRPGSGGAEDERDFAVALVRRARTGEPSAARAVRRALAPLDAACARDPGDLPAGEARGYALGLVGRWEEALAAFEAVLARDPDRELALVGAASAAEALGRGEAAVGHWRKAVAVNPWAPEYRRGFALLLAKREAWAEARTECEAWLGIDPFSTEARTVRVTCLLAAGAKDEARAEFARVEALDPPNLQELRIRFGRKLK